MVRRFAVAVVLALAACAVSPSAFAATCTGAQIASGQCSVGGGTTGGGVDLWGDVTTDGSDGESGDGGTDECPVVINGRCEGASPPKDGVAPTTVNDIASFTPHTPTQFLEPNGWSLRGVPTNFWSTIGPHTVSGELLGNPAAVRFTPVRFRRYFGDGRRQTSDDAGRTWRELGQEPWTRTRTSHSYSDASQYRVRLVVWFSAEFRFGEQEWRTVEGLVTARANDLSLTVFDAETLLVARPCVPGAIGCRLG